MKVNRKLILHSFLCVIASGRSFSSYLDISDLVFGESLADRKKKADQFNSIMCYWVYTLIIITRILMLSNSYGVITYYCIQ